MKCFGLVVLALLMAGCIYKPLYEKKENMWSYFEDWDEDKDSNISKDEFRRGYLKDEMIRKISSNAKSVTYDEFEKFIQEWEKKSSRQSGEKTAEEAAKRDITSFDPDGDKKLSEEEIAQAMFTIADDNHDSEVTSLEFYHWEVYM